MPTRTILMTATCIVAASTAGAEAITYMYQGRTFSSLGAYSSACQFDPAVCNVNAFSTSDSFTGFVTLDIELGTPAVGLSPLEWAIATTATGDFFGAIDLWAGSDNQNEAFISLREAWFDVDEEGRITNWVLSPYVLGGTVIYEMYSSSRYDRVWAEFAHYNYTGRSDGPGNWTAVSVAEPPVTILLGLGLIWIFSWSRRGGSGRLVSEVFGYGARRGTGVADKS